MILRMGQWKHCTWKKYQQNIQDRIKIYTSLYEATNGNIQESKYYFTARNGYLQVVNNR